MEEREAEAERLNQMPGKLEGFDCPLCRNRGFSYIATPGALPGIAYLSTRDCECMVRRRNERRIERSGLQDLLTRYTFDTWRTVQKWQGQALNLAKQYAEGRCGWFLAAGQSGSGKTHLCTAICAELLNAGLDVRYVLWRDMSIQAKAVVNDDEEYQRITSPLKQVKVLYIDDLFKVGRGKEPTSGDVNLAFELLNARYNDSSKLTIISTERSMEDLMDIDEAVGSRIYERSKSYRLDFSDKPNWRIQE
jgi:DNA replication protein DnaC